MVVSASSRAPESVRAQALALLIERRRATVGVVGQGYVGYPLAQRAAEEGFRTVGFDREPGVVRDRTAANRQPGYLASAEVADLRACDVIIVAVPTPTCRTSAGVQPDLSAVLDATRMLRAEVLDDGRPRLLVFESTYAPGTTRTRIAPLLAEQLAPAGNLWLGYSPERIDPGNARYTLGNTPKITSGHNAAAARLTRLFYAALVEQVVVASSMEAAEAAKMLENTFRFVNIGFAQEFDEYCARAGLSAREITDLAATKPFGFLPFYAGAGIGGHCIAEDPYFLHAAMRSAGAETGMLSAAIENHERRANVIVARLRERLPARSLRGSRILLLGVAYKPNVADTRRSPAAEILRLLEAAEATVAYHDPLVPAFAGRRSLDMARTSPSACDLAVVVTAHTTIDLAALAEAGWRLFDTRGLPAPTARRTRALK